MGYLWTTLLGLAALAWTAAFLQLARGVRSLPRLPEAAPLPKAACPSVSILFSARNEAAKLPRALPTLLAQDYPNFQVVAADDRSTDGTAELLDEFARRNQQLEVVHIGELPADWLGKPHGLAKAYERSRGEWLVFTDADVRFAPDVLSRALALARQSNLDHLTLLGRVEVKGFWEKTLFTYFGLGFLLHARPWQASRAQSRCYTGVGSFQLIQRGAYEAIGTHERLRMEVVDDMKLGKLVKQGGFRSAVALADDDVQVRWQDGVANMVRGLEKNFFAAADYSVARALVNLFGLGLLGLGPFALLPFVSGTARLLGAAALAALLLSHGVAARGFRLPPLYALTHPVGAAFFCYILLRSMTVTLWRGGVVWRGTFYPLAALRRGSV